MALEVEAPKPAPQVEVPPPAPEPQAAATEAPMAAEGAKPEVADPAVEAAKPQSASEQAFEPNAGVHYWDEYKNELDARGQSSKWDPKYAAGHTDAQQFVQPYEGRYAFEWSLKKGQSASEGLQNFLKGFTVGEYRSIGVAVEVDEVRDYLGDKRFDQLFGSKDAGEDAQIDPAQRLKITASAYTTPIDEQMKEIAAKDEAKRNEAKPAGQDQWAEYDSAPKEDKASKADELVKPKQPVTDEATQQKQ